MTLFWNNLHQVSMVKSFNAGADSDDGAHCAWRI